MEFCIGFTSSLQEYASMVSKVEETRQLLQERRDKLLVQHAD